MRITVTRVLGGVQNRNKAQHSLVLEMALSCPFCASALPTVSSWLKHIRINHSDSPKFSLTCNLQGCKRTFRSFGTFRNHRNHIYSSHDVNSAEAGATSAEQIEDDSDDSILDDDDSFAPRNDNSTSGTHRNSAEDLKRTAAKFLLKNRETHNIPLSVMDSIVAEVQDLINIVVNESKIRLIECVSQRSVEISIKDDIERELNVANPSIAIFDDPVATG